MPCLFYYSLKILSYRKFKLVNENLLEGIEVVLLVKDKHCLLVVDTLTHVLGITHAPIAVFPPLHTIGLPFNKIPGTPSTKTSGA